MTIEAQRVFVPILWDPLLVTSSSKVTSDISSHEINKKKQEIHDEKVQKNAAKQMSSTPHINPWSLESRGVAALRPNVKKCCCTRDISWNP